MKRMILLITFFVVGIFGLSNTGQPQLPTPTIGQLTPGEVKWITPPGLPGGAQLAVIYGDPSRPGLYVMLIKYPPNSKNPPHTHPVDQVYTVLSGTVYSGVGETFDPNKLKMLPAGSLITMPLNTPHFTETRQEEAILQFAGVGPYGIKYVNPADDPRKK